MPIYEYQCESCGHRLEKIQKMSDDPIKDCPACETPSLKKLVSAAAFRLKGGGWYETDFKTGSKKNVLHGAGSSSDTGTSSDSSSSSSGDSSSSSSSGSDSSTKKDSSAPATKSSD
jgi:putative FmdB family regulatory protein